jgi:hypothetical protein
MRGRPTEMRTARRRARDLWRATKVVLWLVTLVVVAVLALVVYLPHRMAG